MLNQMRGGYISIWPVGRRRTCHQLAKAIRSNKVILEDSNNSHMVDNRNIMTTNSSTRGRAKDKDKARDRMMK